MINDSDRSKMEGLRDSFIKSRYYPKVENNYTWKYLADLAISQPGIIAFSGPSGLQVRHLDGKNCRAFPGHASLLLAGIFSNIAGSQIRCSLGLPPSAREFPLLLAVTTILSKALDEDSTQFHMDGVLIVSTDLAHRSAYSDLFVGSLPLEECFPGSRLRYNGDRILLRSQNQKTRAGVCFFFPHFRDLPQVKSFRPSLIIVDCRHGKLKGRIDQIVSWINTKFDKSAVVYLYSIGDEVLSLLKSKGIALDIPFDHSAVGEFPENKEVESTALDWELSHSSQYLNRAHRFVIIPNAESVIKIFESINSLLKNRGENGPTFRRARWLAATLTQMSVPIVYYEKAVKVFGRNSLRSLIDGFRDYGEGKGNWGPTIQTLRIQFRNLYEKLYHENPRSKTLMNLVRKYRIDSNDIVLVRDRTMVEALTSWCSDTIYPQAEMTIVCLSEFHKYVNRRFERAVISAPIPTKYNWILGSFLAHKVDFTLYDTERKYTERQLKYFYDSSIVNSRANIRWATYEKIIGPYSMDRALPEVLPHLKLEGNAIEKQKDDRSVNDFRNIRNLLNRSDSERVESLDAPTILIESTSELEDEFEEPELLEDESMVVLRVSSTRNGDRELRFQGEAIVDLFRPPDIGELIRLKVSDLRIGDIILIHDQDIRMNLFGTIVQIMEAQSNYHGLAQMRNEWEKAMIELKKLVLKQSNRTRDILSLLRDAGSNISTEATINGWVNGTTIGPESVESIRAVGKIIGSSQIVEQSIGLDQAFHKIRSTHQSIGRRLAGSIRRVFQKTGANEFKEPTSTQLDSLWLPLEDLVDMLDPSEVTGIDFIDALKAGD